MLEVELKLTCFSGYFSQPVVKGYIVSTNSYPHSKQFCFVTAMYLVYSNVTLDRLPREQGKVPSVPTSSELGLQDRMNANLNKLTDKTKKVPHNDYVLYRSCGTTDLTQLMCILCKQFQLQDHPNMNMMKRYLSPSDRTDGLRKDI